MLGGGAGRYRVAAEVVHVPRRLQLPHERALSFAAVMAAAEARAFLQPRLHTLNPVCRTQGELSGKVPKSVCSAFSPWKMRAAVSKT